jgi:hypothetical protein
VIAGPGPHQIDTEWSKHTPLKISGNLCPPEVKSRDIVFVVDVSGSMTSGGGPLGLGSGNDPANGVGTCGRYNAIDELMSSILSVNGMSRFAAATFAGEGAIRPRSSGLFGTEAELYIDLANSGGQSDPKDVLCAGSGSTSYFQGLLAASNIFQTSGRPDATKEIFFISDGANVDEIEESKALANDLRSQGVVIATVMLSGDDTFLRRYIASKDSSGRLLHGYAASASQLAQVLSNLTTNSIERAEVRYRELSQTDWEVVDFTSGVDGNNFVVPDIFMDFDNDSAGVELSVVYWDKLGKEVANGGVLEWDAVE